MASSRAAQREASDLDVRDLGAFTRLARMALFLEALQAECLEPFGLSFTEYTVLRVLHTVAPEQGLAPGRLAEAVLTSSGGMTKIVDRLARTGYVERSTDPSDRRGVLVTLTPKGRATSEAASASYATGRARVLSHLSPAERTAIDVGLQRLLDAFEQDRGARP